MAACPASVDGLLLYLAVERWVASGVAVFLAEADIFLLFTLY